MWFMCNEFEEHYIRRYLGTAADDIEFLSIISYQPKLYRVTEKVVPQQLLSMDFWHYDPIVHPPKCFLFHETHYESRLCVNEDSLSMLSFCCFRPMVTPLQ